VTYKNEAFVQARADHEYCAAARRREGADGAQVHPAHWLLEPLRATCKQNIVDDVGEAEYLSYRVGFLCLLHRLPKARSQRIVGENIRANCLMLRRDVYNCLRSARY
jgi:hypothetical protein